MAPWPFRPSGGSAEAHVMQLMANVRQVIDPTYWDNTSPIPIDVAAGALVRQYIPDIANFVQTQRQRYSLGLVEYQRARATAPQLVVDYINNSGQEIVTVTVQPTTSGTQLPGYYVLIQITVPATVSSPSGSTFSYAVDPVNGTEVPLTVALGKLISGAKIVYKNVDLVVTPVPNYYCYLAAPAHIEVTTAPNGETIAGAYDEASWLAAFGKDLSVAEWKGYPEQFRIGYDEYITSYSFHTVYQGPDNNFFTFNPGSSNTDLAAIANAGGGPAGLAAGGYSVPIGTDPGPWTDYDIGMHIYPWVAGTAYYYTATLAATYVIQLPQILGTLTTPAFSIDTTGYGFNATISIFPSKYISVDKTNPSFPLKWAAGSPPPGADGGVWKPFGVSDTNVQYAYIWQLYYEDSDGTAVPTSYPFVVTYENHLKNGVPVVPSSPPVSLLNYANRIMQMYPTFVNPVNIYGTSGDADGQWYVDSYTDVPYGRIFRPPSSGSAKAWSYSTAAGPLPLLPSSDVPA